MIRITKVMLVLMNFLATSCIFSGSDIEEEKVVDNYYVTSLGDNNSLVYREPDSSTDKILISSNIDSIGWNDEIIVGVTNFEYFIINRQSQSVNNYKDYLQFANACKALNTKKPQLKKYNNSW